MCCCFNCTHVYSKVENKFLNYLFFFVFLIGYFEGKIVPVNQPRLVAGGIMRSYQLDGMEWLKVFILYTWLIKYMHKNCLFHFLTSSFFHCITHSYT